MKNIVIVVLGIILVLLIAGKTYSNNGELIYEGNLSVEVYKIHDGNTKCYLATANQQTSNLLLSGKMISISCVRVK